MPDDSMTPVRASTRISIGWDGAPHDEDTDTLTLTINIYTLDLRVGIKGPAKGAIDWGSVAFVSTTNLKDVEQGAKPILRWDHIIDSRNSEEGDEGAFEDLPNGDVLETGAMVNPATGKKESYEEIWRRYPDRGEYYVLERCDGPWAAEIKPGSHGGPVQKAFLGRIGPRALGLAQDRERFCAYRDDLKDQAWSRVYEFASGDVLPGAADVDAALKEGKVLAEGSMVRIGESEWVVRAAGSV